MQAYCNQKILQSRFPDARVEIIDYRPPETRRKEYSKLITTPGSQLIRGDLPTGFFNQLGKIKAIRRFIQDEMNVSNAYCRTNNIDRIKDFIEKQNYSAIVVGSDIVWSARPGGYEPEQPNIFTLPNINERYKVSLAASMDQTDESHLFTNVRSQRMAKYISDFDYITVRERYTKERLADMGVPKKDINVVCDPTLLWNFKDLIENPKLDLSGNETVGLEIGNISIKEDISENLIESGWEVVNLLGPTFQDEIELSSKLTVPQRLGVYNNLDLIVTDRFHGSIFTLKTSNTPVIYIEPVDKYPESKSKGRDLYERIGIEEQIWRYDGNIPEGVIEDHLTSWNSNKDFVKTGIKSMQENSEPYLNELQAVIEGCQG